jgi:hypothetical protein
MKSAMNSSYVAKLVLLVAVILPGAHVRAQETHAAPQIHGVSSHYKRQSLDERVEHLARYLDLNDGQKSALKNILIQNQQEILKMRRVPPQGEELQMDRLRAIEEKTAERIRALLTEEQRNKYDPLAVRKSNSAAQNVSVDDWLTQTRPR